MKKFKVKLLDEAVNDLEIALDYYQKINPKLAIKFFAATESTFSNLKKNPFYQIRYELFRMKTIKHFPYIVHFIVDELNHIVFVYGIRNSYQNTDKYPTL